MEAPEIAVSHRATADLRAGLEAWLRERLPGSSVAELRRPEGNGMSSETLLLDVVVGDERRRLVARVAPAAEDVPIFPTYDLGMQFRVMELVAERSDTPVPRPLWLEPDASAIGAPFFVMEAVPGRVPKDNLPYTFEGWLLEASARDRIAMQDDTVWALAGIHGVDLAGVDPSFLGHDPTGPPALRQHVESWRRYRDWLALPEPAPVIEAAFEWLERHWPADDGGPGALSWGDARIGNVIYDGFRPAAVLDWEMAGIAPRGVDLGWMAYLHVFFQDIAEQLGLAGLPSFMRLDDLVETYEARTGIRIGDGDFWLVYAGLRYGLVMARIHQRQVAFGEVEPTDDPEAGVMHRQWLARMID